MLASNKTGPTNRIVCWLAVYHYLHSIGGIINAPGSEVREILFGGVECILATRRFIALTRFLAAV